MGIFVTPRIYLVGPLAQVKAFHRKEGRTSARFHRVALATIIVAMTVGCASIPTVDWKARYQSLPPKVKTLAIYPLSYKAEKKIDVDFGSRFFKCFVESLKTMPMAQPTKVIGPEAVRDLFSELDGAHSCPN
jgi:hypothetical protein